MARNVKNIEHKVLSDRGVFLDQAHQRQQNSNINTGMEAVITEDIRVEIGQRFITKGGGNKLLAEFDGLGELSEILQPVD